MFCNTTLDLHGHDRYSAVAEAKTFISRHKKIGNKEITIIHGIGKNILKDEIHKMLKSNKEIEEYKLNMFNLGETIIKL
jgi:dsDNA-specific endonuclease/ATPase MutS2